MLSGLEQKISHHFKNATTREYEVGVQWDFVQHNIHRCLDFMRIVAMSLLGCFPYTNYTGDIIAIYRYIIST